MLAYVLVVFGCLAGNSARGGAEDEALTKSNSLGVDELQLQKVLPLLGKVDDLQYPIVKDGKIDADLMGLGFGADRGSAWTAFARRAGFWYMPPTASCGYLRRLGRFGVGRCNRRLSTSSQQGIRCLLRSRKSWERSRRREQISPALEISEARRLRGADTETFTLVVLTIQYVSFALASWAIVTEQGMASILVSRKC